MQKPPLNEEVGATSSPPEFEIPPFNKYSQNPINYDVVDEYFDNFFKKIEMQRQLKLEKALSEEEVYKINKDKAKYSDEMLNQCSQEKIPISTDNKTKITTDEEATISNESGASKKSSTKVLSKIEAEKLKKQRYMDCQLLRIYRAFRAVDQYEKFNQSEDSLEDAMKILHTNYYINCTCYNYLEDDEDDNEKDRKEQQNHQQQQQVNSNMLV